MGNRAQVFELLAVGVLSVHFHFLARQQFAPEQRLGFDLAVGAAFDERALNRAAVRVVALEVQGVDDDFFNLARMAQCDDDPVIARRTTTCGFPAVAQIGRASCRERV